MSRGTQTLTSQVNKEISNLFQHRGFTSLNVELLSSPQLCEVCGSHSGVAEDSGLLGCYAVLPGNYEGWNFNSGNYLFTTDTK